MTCTLVLSLMSKLTLRRRRFPSLSLISTMSPCAPGSSLSLPSFAEFVRNPLCDPDFSRPPASADASGSTAALRLKSPPSLSSR